MIFSDPTNSENIPHIYFNLDFTGDQNIPPEKVLDTQKTVTYEPGKDVYSFQLSL